jgi:hypothetical protein
MEDYVKLGNHPILEAVAVLNCPAFVKNGPVTLTEVLVQRNLTEFRYFLV